MAKCGIINPIILQFISVQNKLMQEHQSKAYSPIYADRARFTLTRRESKRPPEAEGETIGYKDIWSINGLHMYKGSSLANKLGYMPEY
jgi:hypothetical protein